MKEVNKQDLLNELAIRKAASSNMLVFTKYTKPDFVINWHHKVLATKLQDFAYKRIKKLMIFLPPQVGKSEMSTRRLPAFIHGIAPDTRTAIAAYNQTFAGHFNRDIQRIIADRPYMNVFPGTRINGKDVSDESKAEYARNSDIYEIIGHKGSLKSVGIGGALTGSTVDVGIIDDPIKDAAEAFSHTYRERLWNWYETVFSTRLHNDSQQLITLTRWHNDDLAGRILKNESDWEVVILPAIREDTENKNDPREVGEALWPEKHSLERYLKVKSKNPLIFSSLYQQRPHFNEDEGRFAFAFKRSEHVGRCYWNPSQYTYLTFDFNRNPITCTVIQDYDDTIYIPRCIKLKNSDIYKLCDEIDRSYPNAIFIVTGDATGKASSALVEDNINYYTVIKTKLRLNDSQMQVPAVNPKMESNQVLVNVVLQNHKWCIDEENAAPVIFDMEYVKVGPDGKIDKSDRNDPTKQADALDTVRYWLNVFKAHYLRA